MIQQINNTLAEMGSNYRTTDGLTLCSYIGNMVFLTKHFESQIEMLRFVNDSKSNNRNMIDKI